MKRATWIVILMMCSATAASAQPELRIGGFGFEMNRFYVDVIVTDLAELSGQRLGGIAVGATLTGSGTGHLLANPAAMWMTGPQWAAETAPQTFAWASFDTQSTAANTGGVGGLTTFGMLDIDLTPGPVDLGSVVCRFIYSWDTILPEERSIVIHISGDEGEANPYFVDQNLDTLGAAVAGNDLAMPEPATLGLVALGVSALFVRKRRREL